MSLWGTLRPSDGAINMDGICLRIMQRKEGSLQSFTVFSHPMFGVTEGTCQKVRRLVRGNGKCLCRGDFWIPIFNFWWAVCSGMIGTTGIFQFTERRQQAGTVCLILPVFTTQSEFYRMPVAVS